jgi:hypothetical protein
LFVFPAAAAFVRALQASRPPPLSCAPYRLPSRRRFRARPTGFPAATAFVRALQASRPPKVIQETVHFGFTCIKLHCIDPYQPRFITKSG